MRADRERTARSMLIASVVSAGLIGCSGSDLRGYRPFEKSEKVMDAAQTPKVSLEKSDAETLPSQEAAGTNEVSDRSLYQQAETLTVSALAPVNVVDGSDVGRLLQVAPAEKRSESSPVDPATRSGVAQAGAADPPKPRVTELLVPDKTFQTDAASKALRVSYDDLDLLKVLNLDPVGANAVDLMPAWLKSLSGQRIRLRGFMFPGFESEGITRFVLARDNQICCFGRDPKVYDLVQVDLKSGTSTNYIPATRAFDVVGRFKIEMTCEDGKPFGLYYIEEAQVIDR